jgi:hypothetical protein
MPTAEEVQQKIIEAICAVQEASGEQQPILNAKSCPLKELKGFDSPLGVVVTGLVAIGLDVEIPLDANIFVDDGRRALTIEESTAVVCKVMKAREESKQ